MDVMENERCTTHDDFYPLLFAMQER